jgi:hypothetical protein
MASAPSVLFGALRQNPMLFNAITGGVLCASSDALAQQMEHQETITHCSDHAITGSSTPTPSERPYLAPSMATLLRNDWSRTVGAGLIGSFFGGIVYPLAYARLDSIWVGTRLVTVIKKSLVEIATVGIFVNSISMMTRGILRGDKDTQSVFQHVYTELPTITRNDFIVWMPYNMIAFSIIPAFLRPTTTAAMEASWQTYISLRAHDFETDEASIIATTVPSK